MKTFALTLFISAFLVLSIADPCSDAYEFADMSINSLRNNFFDDQYANMYEDLENVMKSAELIKDSCVGAVNFSINGSQYYTCSLAYSTLSQILDDYGFQRDAETVSTLSQIVSLIPSVEDKYCLDDWEITALKNQDNFDDEVWTDFDRTDDYDYDRSDAYTDSLIQDEEEDDTGDEIYRYSDNDEEDIEQDQAWPTDEIQEYGSDIPSDYEDDESEDEDDEIESDDENDATDSMIASEINEQEDTIMVFVDVSNESNLLAEVEIEVEEDMLAEDIPTASKEEQDMIMVFVDMTGMSSFGNIEGLLDGEEEESLTIYADTSVDNGELTFEEGDNKAGSIFVYVDIDTALGVDQVVSAVFADNQDDDVEADFGELDLQQYWDDEEDEDDY